MADVQIGDLPSDSSIVSSDIFLFQDGSTGETKQTTAANLPIQGTPATRLSNPYKFSAYTTNGTSLGAATWTKVAFNIELFDTSNNFDSTTNFRFTAPVAGFYQFNADVGVTISGMSNTAVAQAALYLNGSARFVSPVMVGSGNANFLPRYPFSVLLQLAAGDYIEMYAYCSEASRNIDTGADRTYMQGYLVCTT